MENRIEIDDMAGAGFEREYLPATSPMASQITNGLQEEVDAYMDGLRPENRINREATQAAVTAICGAVSKMRRAGIQVDYPDYDSYALLPPEQD